MTDLTRRLLAVAAFSMIAATANAQEPVSAAAITGKDFLASFAGNWRGSGEAKVNPKSAPTKVTCKLSAVFDAGQSLLSNNGRCGTTQGSQEMSGRVAADGDALKGEFIAGMDTSKLRKQRLTLVDGTLVSEAEMDDENGGKVIKLRTVLTQPKDGAFVVQNQFYDWAKASWITGGEIAFKKQ